MTKNKLEKTFQEALRFASSHYENFPVLSRTLPRKIRKHIAIVYKFARQADDLADEGEESEERRTKSLELYENDFTNCLNGKYKSDFWSALQKTIDEFNLTPKNFYDLLSAFKQDVVKKRYENFAQLLDYCTRSANPVGRIILEFHDIKNEEALRASDAICTALQLTNFYQDVSIDYLKGRIYIPEEEMEKFGIEEKIFEDKQNNSNFKQLMSYQVERTSKLFSEGRKIFNHLPRSLKPQIKITVLGGEKILEKIVQADFNVLKKRPVLLKLDYINIFLRVLLNNV